MATDKERISTLETHISYIRTTVESIDKKVDDLSAFKFKVMGAASVLAAIISFVVASMAR